MSYPSVKKKSASGIIVLLKTPTKCREFFPISLAKTSDFQLVFNFEQTRTVTIIFRENGTMPPMLMAKPIRALELNYPMIQFLIRWYSFIIGALFFGYSNLLLVHLRLKHRRNVFSFRMVEPTALQGPCLLSG